MTNRIPVAEGHEADFEERFRNRKHLVDQAPGFIRNEVHRPRPMRFDHEQGGFVPDAEREGYYEVKTWFETLAHFEAWTRSDAFAEAHANRPPKEMFRGASALEIHEVFLANPAPHEASTMLDHTGVVVSDAEQGARFYDAVLASLGYELLAEHDGHRGYGPQGWKPQLWVSPGMPKATQHVALTAKTHEAVRAFHAAGLAAGGTDHGAPGFRTQYHPAYYAAFLLDPDGHNIEAVCLTGGRAG